MYCHEKIYAENTNNLLEEGEYSQKDKANTEEKRTVNTNFAMFAEESANFIAVVNGCKIDDVAYEKSRQGYD